jgi:hypothetical protein
MVSKLIGALAACLLAVGAWAHDHGGSTVVAKPDFSAMWQARQQNAPRLAIAAQFDANGRLWLARAVGPHLQVSHSDDAGRQFSQPVTVNAVPELISADGEARPQIAVVGEQVYVSWTQSLPEPFAGHVRISVSADGGQHFSAPLTVNDDRQPITHRFNAMQATEQGVTLAWIDKRDGHGRSDYRGAAIYTAESRDGGRSFATNRKLADHSCECCRLGMAADLDGTPLVFWRQIFGRNIRDFALARLGAPLQRVSEDGWAIDACPHHGGWLAVDQQGGRHLAWFTGAEPSPGLHYRRIDGKRMTPPLPFGDLDAQAGHPALVTLGAQVHLAWREFDGQAVRIMGMRSADRGETWSSPHVLASTAGAADDPLLLSGRGTAWLVWNTVADGLKMIALAQ